MRLLLDTNVLRKICHPKRHPEVMQWLQAWLERVVEGDDVEVIVSAAADFELRRGYLWKLDRHPDERLALARLNAIVERLGIQPVSNDHFQTASRFWADARRGGYQTADDRNVDWDVIIASQAAEIGAVVVTSNAQHLARYGVEARDWLQIPVPTD